jgi:hypothetical protein
MADKVMDLKGTKLAKLNSPRNFFQQETSMASKLVFHQQLKLSDFFTTRR